MAHSTPVRHHAGLLRNSLSNDAHMTACVGASDKDQATTLTGSMFVGLLEESTISAQDTPSPYLAANSTTLMRTPERAAVPNSAKKRRPMPDLSRAVPSPGHGAKMSTIFRDASATIQASGSPSCRSFAPDIKRSRLPLSQARNTKFGASKANAVLSSRIELHCSDLTEDKKLNSSSGFANPCIPCVHPSTGLEVIQYPCLEGCQLPHSSSIASVASSSSSDDKCAQSGQDTIDISLLSKLTLDAQSAQIDSWLDGIPDPVQNNASPGSQQNGSDGRSASAEVPHVCPSAAPLESDQRSGSALPSKPPENSYSLSRASSNKENLSPAKHSPSPPCPSPQYLTRTPARFRTVNRLTPTRPDGTRRFEHSLSLQGYLSLPPKRKKARLNVHTNNNPELIPKAGNDFTIHEDQVVEALAQLSPLVECHRKGRGPKRERCTSYFDEDIIHTGSPKVSTGTHNGGRTTLRSGRNVLGESKQSVALTKEEPFLEEAESATFDFNV